MKNWQMSMIIALIASDERQGFINKLNWVEKGLNIDIYKDEY
jgi:hypothetical protein